MIDADTIGARLYGGSEATTPAPAPTPPKDEAAIAEALYKPAPAPVPRDLPAAVAELRATPERRLFDVARNSTAIAVGALDLPEYAIDNAEAIRVTADLGASADDLAEFSTLVGQHRDVDQSTFDAWHAEASAMVGEGKEFSASDLDMARRFVARDPAVHAYLDRSGLGSHPDVVRKVVQLARSARGRGERF
jgi:hypothetical protein